MIDLHCHLLPGVDDGPSTMADAVSLAQALAAAGAAAAVVTPHVDYTWSVDPHEIAPAVAALRPVLEDAGVDLALHSGAEVALDRLLDLDDAARDAIRLGGGPYLLVESPHATVSGAFLSVLQDLLVHGERVILAHPERCPSFQRRPESLAALVDAGALCSITAGSMQGRFGGTVRGFTVDLLRRRLVHNVASDAHDVTRRPPGLLAGFHALEPQLPGLSGQLEWMTQAVPSEILAGS
jgi:protein-tyrosine phosphatase